MFTFPEITSGFYLTASPVFVLTTASLIALLAGISRGFSARSVIEPIAWIAIVGALFCAAMIPADATSYLAGGLVSGPITKFASVSIMAIAAAVMLMIREHHTGNSFFRGEVIGLFFMLLCGMLVMVGTDDLVSLFVGLELASIGLYAVLGYISPNRRSQEGAIKYFILGSVAAAVLLFGMALLYASCGTMRLSMIVEALPSVAGSGWARLGAMLTVAGLGFKLALVPFHMWAPDAYESAPTGITAFMATSVKVMILTVVFRLMVNTYSSLADVWYPALVIMAVLSMIGGNIMALVQVSMKRMLAYSSIAHSGYMAVAICALGLRSSDLPVRAILFYLISYVVVSIGAFAIVSRLESAENDQLTIDDMSGLAKKQPLIAAIMTIFLLSFGGMPPTAGFIAKFFVFNAALSKHLYGLVLIGVIGSSISLYYYLRVVVRMYMTEEQAPFGVVASSKRWSPAMIMVGLAAVLTLLLGTVLPGQAMEGLTKTSSEVAKK